MKTHTLIMIAGTALFVSGCAEKKINFASNTPVADTCEAFGQRATLDQSGVTTKRLSPGESSTLQPMLYQGPAVIRGDNDCVRELVVTPDNGAQEDEYTLTEMEDGRVQFSLSESATPGGRFVFSARYGDGFKIADAIYVYDFDRWPLEGVWSQSRSECGESAIGELEFTRGGFGVTWQPFESYKDYWGSYEFERADADAVDGTLSLKTTGGNYLAVGKEEHTLRVKVDGETLTMVEDNFGNPQRGGSVCDAPFKRR